MARTQARYVKLRVPRGHRINRVNKNVSLGGFSPVARSFLGLWILTDETRDFLAFAIPMAVVGRLSSLFLSNDSPGIAVAIFLFGLALTSSFVWRMRKASLDRTRSASHLLLSKLRQQHHVDFVFGLYLRPFKTDTAPTSSDFVWPIVSSTLIGGAYTPRRAVLEMDVSKFCAGIVSDLPVLCLGRAGETDSIARLTVSDEEWREVVEALSEQARLVFLVVGSGDGTLWEINRTLHSPQLLEKTIFVIPPDDVDVRKPSGWAASEYGSARSAFEELGFSIPEYRKLGGFFIFPDGDSTPAVMSLDVDPVIAGDAIRVVEFASAALCGTANPQTRPSGPPVKTRSAEPMLFMRATRSITWPLWAVAAITLAGGLYWGLVIAPPDYQQGETVRWMYVHAPAGVLAIWCAFLLGPLVIWSSLSRLLGAAPLLADIATLWMAGIGLGLTFITLGSGSWWGHVVWGTWWEWEVRLAATAFLALCFAAYLIVQYADPAGFRFRDLGLATFIGWVAMLTHFAPEWFITLHQSSSFYPQILSQREAIDASMWLPLLTCFVGFALLVMAILASAIRATVKARRSNSALS